MPSSLALIAIGRTPLTLLMLPERESSPIKAELFISTFICLVTSKRAIIIGKS